VRLERRRIQAERLDFWPHELHIPSAIKEGNPCVKPNLVEAAGVEPDIGVENAQLIDSGNA
jgi:hypothetical protein